MESFQDSTRSAPSIFGAIHLRISSHLCSCVTIDEDLKDSQSAIVII